MVRKNGSIPFLGLNNRKDDMGDRAQIKVDATGVYLYSHWTGSGLSRTLAGALDRGRERWDDSEYLARIIFCEMVRGEELSTTGYGIGTTEHDDVEYPTLVIKDRAVNGVPFEQFIAQNRIF